MVYTVKCGDMNETVEAEDYQEAFAKALEAAERKKDRAANLAILFEVTEKGGEAKYSDTVRQLHRLGRMAT